MLAFEGVLFEIYAPDHLENICFEVEPPSLGVQNYRAAQHNEENEEYVE